MKLFVTLWAVLISAALTVKAETTPLLTGQPLFAKKCALCHGTGNGNAKMAGMLKVDAAKLDLTKSRVTSDEILHQLQNGKNKMPAFKTLTPEQMKSLVDYVMSLRSTK